MTTMTCSACGKDKTEDRYKTCERCRANARRFYRITKSRQMELQRLRRARQRARKYNMNKILREPW